MYNHTFLLLGSWKKASVILNFECYDIIISFECRHVMIGSFKCYDIMIIICDVVIGSIERCSHCHL